MSLVPAPVGTAGRFVSVACGEHYSAGINAEGEVYTWGRYVANSLHVQQTYYCVTFLAVITPARNESHQLGYSVQGKEVQVIDDARNLVECRSALIVRFAYVQSVPRLIATLTAPVTKVALGWDHACAVTAGGRLYTWGTGAFGQVSQIITNPKSKTLKLLSCLSTLARPRRLRISSEP